MPTASSVLLACGKPSQLYSVSRVSPPVASASCIRSIIGHASYSTHRRPRMRMLYPGLSIAAVTPPGCAQRRGKKTRTRVKLDELPQALVKPEPLPDLVPDGLPAYPLSMLQVRHNMQKFENCVLLTRMGGFYELYFEHAEEYAPLLGLKTATKKTNAGPVAMAGFPFFQLERYLKVLVIDLNCYVAVAEEFPNDPEEKIKAGGRTHDRRVTRVITPGTLIDEGFMDPYSNNYVLAVHVDHEVGQSSTANNLATGGEDLDLSSTPVGLAWVDVSTGQFYTQHTTVGSLPSILSRVGPREIVVSELLQSRKDHYLFSVLAEDKHFITYARQEKLLPISEWGDMLESEMSAQKIAQFTSNETQAGSMLLQYVTNRLQGLSIKLQPPLQYEDMAVLALDKNTLRALEIKQTIRDGVFRGSLLHAVRRTVTNGGARLLNSWLSAPSTCLETIQARQDLVEYFIQNEHHRNDVVLLLKKSHDSQRLVQKFAFGRADADDLLYLANTIHATRDIVNILGSPAGLEGSKKSKPAKRGRKSKKNQDVDSSVPAQSASCFASLLSRIALEELTELAERIRMSIDEEGLVQQQENEENETSQLISMAEAVVAAEGTQGDAVLLPKSTKRKKPISIRDHYAEDSMNFVMKPEASTALKGLHVSLSSLLQEKEEMESALRESLAAPSLTLRWVPNFGHIGHVKGKDMKASSMSDHPTVSSSRTTKAVQIAEWTALGQRIHQTRFEIGTEETRIFADLRAAVIANLVRLRRNALVLDELDVAASFARLAIEKGLTRPILNNSTAHTIIGGRHPTVEGGLNEQGRSFTKNDCLVGQTAIAPSTPTADSAQGQDDKTTSAGRIWLITGPNMAGKSTYLRQNALITVLAQVGCYVPASHATLGIVDAVFSRVGSADNLYRDQSTFMVEMLETAQILRQATPRSFVIMDEIGRGTTPDDGTAIAFACLHHLATVNKCRGLFATHFHLIADLVHEHGLHVSNSADGGPVETYCTDIEEDGEGGFVYVHKLRKGVNRQSHALKVARLSGLPDAAIELAQRVLERKSPINTEEDTCVRPKKRSSKKKETLKSPPQAL